MHTNQLEVFNNNLRIGLLIKYVHNTCISIIVLLGFFFLFIFLFFIFFKWKQFQHTQCFPCLYETFKNTARDKRVSLVS